MQCSAVTGGAARINCLCDDRMILGLCPLQTSQAPGAPACAANCLMFSDVKETRPEFSQHLIIPMNYVTIPIWPGALRRRTVGINSSETWKLERSLSLRCGLECVLQMTADMQGAALAYEHSKDPWDIRSVGRWRGVWRQM